MTKRLISANASDIMKMTPAELKQSIRASEGRVVLTEVVPVRPAFIGDITQAEIAAAFGSDMILLNGVDLIDPKIYGIDDTEHFVDELHQLVGRPIGVNLEPVDPNAHMAEEKRTVSEGRQVSEKTAKLLQEHHLDFVCITGNPGTGVTNELIKESVGVIKEHFDGLVIAGKMHGAGVAEPVADKKTLEALIDAGVDILLVPAVGTVPGFTQEDLQNAVQYAHERGALVMTAIGTSQEGADVETIRQIALYGKIAGVDIQHIGDAGYHGMALVENIYAMSNTIRGIRHTISRIARSVNR
ncbi:haloacid dehalogenase-like hydrolase [Atopobacter sp. AH10]|nr:haloacid dehalogenase-like hydrolase [Atopobacter sp. AH10]